VLLRPRILFVFTKGNTAGNDRPQSTFSKASVSCTDFLTIHSLYLINQSMFLCLCLDTLYSAFLVPHRALHTWLSDCNQCVL